MRSATAEATGPCDGAIPAYRHRVDARYLKVLATLKGASDTLDAMKLVSERASNEAKRSLGREVKAKKARRLAKPPRQDE